MICRRQGHSDFTIAILGSSVPHHFPPSSVELLRNDSLQCCRLKRIAGRIRQASRHFDALRLLSVTLLAVPVIHPAIGRNGKRDPATFSLSRRKGGAAKQKSVEGSG
jgi:hypothetical protein